MNTDEHGRKTEPEPGVRRRAVRLLSYLCLSVCICGFLFFHRLADRDLWSSHEARAAMDAQTILDDGAWGLPHLFDGRPELQKPPLYYWLVALSARWQGGMVDAWAVRLPSALSALGCVVTVFWFLWRRGRPLAGLIAATVLATAVHFTWLARVGRIDMPLTLAVSVVMCGLLEFSGRPRGGALSQAPPRARPLNEGRTLLIVAYFALAVGLLLKGPIALALPAAALGVFALIEGNWRHPLTWATRLGLWWGIPLALGIAAIWFISANRASGNELSRTFFLHHNIDRAFGENV